MGLLTWIKNKIQNGNTQITPTDSSEFFSLISEVYIRKLAFQSAINIIANAISKCEFQTFFEHKEVKTQEYYLWNFEPNKNQNSSVFLKKLITKLYENNDCLVIEVNGQLLVADSFNKTEYALLDYKFESVTVDNYTFNKTFYMSDVLYFKLNNENVRNVINGLFSSYSQLIAYAEKSYKKSRGSRGILNISTMASGEKDFENKINNLLNVKFKNFFNAENAVLPLYDGYKYEDTGSKTYSSETTRDIKAMIDDIFDFTGRALFVPPVMLKGEVASAKDAVNDFLTFCIDPLKDMMQEEINRKRNGYEAFKNGTYLKINTKCIKHVDLLSVATAIDKLIGSGAFCVNDIRRLVDEEPIIETWANEHFMTKNYSTIDDLLATMQVGTLDTDRLKGGESKVEE